MTPPTPGGHLPDDGAPAPGAPASTVTRRVALVAWLTAVWCALWEDVRPGNVLAGIAVGTAVALLVRLGSKQPRSTIRPLPTVRFAAWFAWALLTSTARVVVQVLRPGPPPPEGIVAVPIRGCSDTVITVVANAISLTPGTITIEARRGEPALLFVHVLGLTDLEATRAEILDLEARAVRAFGPDEAVAALDDLPPTMDDIRLDDLPPAPLAEPGGPDRQEQP